MSIPKADGRFCVCYWLDPESDGPEDHYEYTDTLIEAADKAERVMRGSRYRWSQVCRWNDDVAGWEFVSDHEPLGSI